jgi:hypothetical protein
VCGDTDADVGATEEDGSAGVVGDVGVVGTSGSARVGTGVVERDGVFRRELNEHVSDGREIGRKRSRDERDEGDDGRPLLFVLGPPGGRRCRRRWERGQRRLLGHARGLGLLLGLGHGGDGRDGGSGCGGGLALADERGVLDVGHDGAERGLGMGVERPLLARAVEEYAREHARLRVKHDLREQVHESGAAVERVHPARRAGDLERVRGEHVQLR